MLHDLGAEVCRVGWILIGRQGHEWLASERDGSELSHESREGRGALGVCAQSVRVRLEEQVKARLSFSCREWQIIEDFRTRK